MSPMEGDISSCYKRCAGSLEATINSKNLEAEGSSVPLALWEDILVRLKLFASNIGAHQVGTMSLDYRLREATHLRDRLLVTFSSIGNAIDDINEILSARNLSPDDEDFMSAEERRNELRDIHSTLQTLVNSMFQLSMTIRKPGRVQRIQNMSGEDDGGASFMNLLDLHRIADNFPRASLLLHQRLASATARRRATLKYLERRHQKLGEGIDGGDDGEESTALSSRVATALVENDLEYQTSRSDAGVSETSFGTSLFSSNTRRTMPPPPAASGNGQPFECPYCFYIIRVSGSLSWARHVFRDLSPYICPFEDCSIPGRLYESRRAWEGHIKQDHSDLLHDTRCLLCHESQLRHNMNSHLARHLQDVALFVLPPSVLDDQESDTQSDISSTKSESLDEEEDQPALLVDGAITHNEVGDRDAGAPEAPSHKVLPEQMPLPHISENGLAFLEEDRGYGDPAPAPHAANPPAPQIINGPTVHQEVITHHRHIDHGSEVRPEPIMDQQSFGDEPVMSNDYDFPNQDFTLFSNEVSTDPAAAKDTLFADYPDQPEEFATFDNDLFFTDPSWGEQLENGRSVSGTAFQNRKRAEYLQYREALDRERAEHLQNREARDNRARAKTRGQWDTLSEGSDDLSKQARIDTRPTNKANFVKRDQSDEIPWGSEGLAAAHQIPLGGGSSNPDRKQVSTGQISSTKEEGKHNNEIDDREQNYGEELSQLRKAPDSGPSQYPEEKDRPPVPKPDSASLPAPKLWKEQLRALSFHKKIDPELRRRKRRIAEYAENMANDRAVSENEANDGSADSSNSGDERSRRAGLPRIIFPSGTIVEFDSVASNRVTGQ